MKNLMSFKVSVHPTHCHKVSAIPVTMQIRFLGMAKSQNNYDPPKEAQ